MAHPDGALETLGQGVLAFVMVSALYFFSTDVEPTGVSDANNQVPSQ